MSHARAGLFWCCSVLLMLTLPTPLWAAPATRWDACASFERCDAACTQGRGAACLAAATLLRRGLGPASAAPGDDQRRFERACQVGDPTGCWLAARGRWESTSAAEVRAAASRACEAGSPDACRAAAVGPEAEARRARADDLARAACAEGGVYACIGLDPARARLTLPKACDAGAAEACQQLARMLERGVGGPQDARGALTRYEAACGLGDAISCDVLAARRAGQGQARAAKEALAAAQKGHLRRCQVGEPRSCGLVAAARAQEAPGEAAAALSRGCRAGALDLCARAIRIHRRAGPTQDLAAAAALADGLADRLSKRVELGRAGAATLLAQLTEAGDVLAKGGPTPVQALQRGCLKGDAEACLALGASTEKGQRGLARDPGRAFALKARACRLGHYATCRKLRGPRAAEAAARSPREGQAAIDLVEGPWWLFQGAAVEAEGATPDPEAPVVAVALPGESVEGEQRITLGLSCRLGRAEVSIWPPDPQATLSLGAGPAQPLKGHPARGALALADPDTWLWALLYAEQARLTAGGRTVIIPIQRPLVMSGALPLLAAGCPAPAPGVSNGP